MTIKRILTGVSQEKVYLFNNSIYKVYRNQDLAKKVFDIHMYIVENIKIREIIPNVELINRSESNLYFLKMDFIEGEHITSLNPKNLEQIRMVIENLQDINPFPIGINDFFQRYSIYTHYMNSLSTIDLITLSEFLDVRYLNRIVEKFNSSELFFRKNNKNHVLTHGDLHPFNIIWSNDKIVGIIDFDQTTIAPDIFDYLIVSLRFSIANNLINKNSLDLFDTLEKNITFEEKINFIYCYVGKIILEKIYFYFTTKDIKILNGNDNLTNWLKVYKFFDCLL